MMTSGNGLANDYTATLFVAYKSGSRKTIHCGSEALVKAAKIAKSGKASRITMHCTGYINGRNTGDETWVWVAV